MPIRGDFDDAGEAEGGHGMHPVGSLLRGICGVEGGERGVGEVVGLGVVVHERMVVFLECVCEFPRSTDRNGTFLRRHITGVEPVRKRTRRTYNTKLLQ